MQTTNFHKPKAYQKMANVNEFKKRIEHRKTEEIDALEFIEKFYLKKKGRVVEIPKPGNHVILLVSGGIDSITTWFILMHTHKLHVHPLFLKRGHKRHKREWASVNYFSNFYKKRYKKYFHQPQVYTVSLPPPELELMISKPLSYFHPRHILKGFDPTTKTSEQISSSIVSAYMCYLYGMFYSKQLHQNKNIKVRAVVTGILPEDGEYMRSQSLTALRLAQLTYGIITKDYSKQLFSLAFEKEIGSWLEKQALIKIATDAKLPLEFTWTCGRNGPIHCGACNLCKKRRESFEQAQISDPTFYLNMPKRTFVKTLAKRMLQQVLDKIQSDV